VIQDFEISITAVGDDQYLVRTEHVEKGVQLAEEKVRWPVAQWLETTKVLMHDPLLGLLQGQQRHTLPTRAGQSGTRSMSNPNDATLINLGQTLHNALFRGQLHDSWVTAQGVAQNRQDLLRLRIGMKDSRLQQLPWEALHAGTRPLATGTDVIFSRYILDRRQGHSVQLAKEIESEKILRILMVIASPDDQERLELRQEVHHLQSELHPVEAQDDDALLDVQLKILEQPGRAELTQELDRGNYQVLHYAGHSNLGNAGGDLFLVSRQTGLTERLSGEDLAGLLVNNGIKLAVFNSCRGGYSSSSEQGWQERNLAQALVNRGMPGVIAMAERIPDHVAITFTQLLYRNLKKGQSIDLSLNRTRQGLISAYGSHQFYWALPTLYMQPSFDGYLMKTAGDRESASLLDAINDPFGGIFAEPGLADIDWPPPRGNSATRVKPKRMQTAKSVMRSQGADESNVGRPTSSDAATDSRLGDRASNLINSLVDNNDAVAATAMGKRLAKPLQPLAKSVAAQGAEMQGAETQGAEAQIAKIDGPEIDGELHVPEEIETPSGFYGERPVATPPSTTPASSDLSSTTKISTAHSTAHTDSRADASSTNKSGRTDHQQSKKNTTNQQLAGLSPQNEPSELLVGERLTRSHTLHTKLLTVPGLASIALAVLLSFVTVGWFQRASQMQEQGRAASTPSSVAELGLPAQAEIALGNDDLDAATAAIKGLIDNNEYEAALAVIQGANTRQQKDVIMSFLKGRAQWSLEKQGSAEYSPADAMRSWLESLENEPDWMEIAMALGFSQYAVDREDLAIENWQRAIALADRQSEQYIYFSEQPVNEYILNAHAGVAMASLALSKIETNPTERNRLLAQAEASYLKVIDEAAADFGAQSLGDNWLWLSPAIADWTQTKRELSQTVQ